MKAFLAEKGKGFYATMTTAVCLLAGILCFVVLLQGPVEADENPALVICLAVAALVLCLVSAYKDFFKLPTLAAFICTTIAAIFYLRGRVSYLAYYFTGDVLPARSCVEVARLPKDVKVEIEVIAMKK